MTEFDRYMPDLVEYPRDIAVYPLPLGVQYIYVSDSLLDGFINYVTPIKAFVLGRYEEWDQPLHNGPKEIQVMEPPGSFHWIYKTCATKADIYREVTVKGAVFHTTLSSLFQDDVLILAVAKGPDPSRPTYVYFWYDCDVSDCCIGRFETDDPQEKVIEVFETYVTKDLLEIGSNPYGSKEIPLHFFSGWLRG